MQFGFAKQKSTSKVDTSKIYGPGNHFIGPDFEFKKFRSDAHTVELDKITAFTSDKLEVKDISIYLCLFLFLMSNNNNLYLYLSKFLF